MVVECLVYFKPLKCAHIFFLQKSQLSILGNLSCKPCSASRGGASLHKYNFLLLYTFALQRIKQVISICLQAFLEVLMWCGQKLFPSPLKYLSFFYYLAPQDLFTYVLLPFFAQKLKKETRIKKAIKGSRFIEYIKNSKQKSISIQKIQKWYKQINIV